MNSFNTKYFYDEWGRYSKGAKNRMGMQNIWSFKPLLKEPISKSVKKNYFLLLFILPFVVNAQKKVDLDRFHFTVQYRALPQVKLDSTYRTYNVVVEGTKLMQQYLQEIDPEKSVVMESWKKLPQDGHLTIKVKLEDLLPESVSVKERVESSKDRNGVISAKTYYHEEVVYSFAANAVINDYKGMHVTDQALADRQYKQVYKSPEFALRPLAEGYFILNALNINRELYRNCVTRAMHYLSERITENFGFNKVSSNDYMYIIGSRKHPEYEDNRRAMQQLQEVLFGMSAETPIDGAREKLKPVIDYFEGIKSTYTTTSKHDRKIRYASYFNLAVLYYYLDDPQAMMKEANGLALNDYDAKDAKGFIQTATWLKNQFQQANIYTRHFSIDPSTFKGPYENSNAKAVLK